MRSIVTWHSALKCRHLIVTYLWTKHSPIYSKACLSKRDSPSVYSPRCLSRESTHTTLLKNVKFTVILIQLSIYYFDWKISFTFFKILLASLLIWALHEMRCVLCEIGSQMSDRESILQNCLYSTIASSIFGTSRTLVQEKFMYLDAPWLCPGR